MSIRGKTGALAALFMGFYKRENTPIRQSFAVARKILYSEKEIEEGKLRIINALKEGARDASRDLLAGTKEVKQGIEEFRKDFRELINDEILIIFHILHTFREVVQKQKQIDVDVPVIKPHEFLVEKQMQKILRTAANLQNPLEQLNTKAHRKHFFARDLFSENHSLLKDKNLMDDGFNQFNKGLEEHIIKKVIEGSKDMEKAGERMYEHLTKILQDTISLVYIILADIKELISKEKKLKGKFPDIVNDEKWAENQLAAIIADAKQSIRKLQSLTI